MPKAIDVLMNEHRLIERVLGSLSAYAGSLREGVPLERSRAREFGEFFSRFADAVHHGKEEDLLFARLADYGFSRDAGPVAVMLHEHEIGRRLVGAIRQIGDAAGPVSTTEGRLFLDSARSYPDMLLSHIQKEDQILYPMATQVLPPAEMDRLAEQYRDFEERAVGRGVIDGLVELGETLVATYPFDPAFLEMAEALPCHRR